MPEACRSRVRSRKSSLLVAVLLLLGLLTAQSQASAAAPGPNWSAVPGGLTVMRPPAAVAFDNREYLFAVGSDRKVYYNVLTGNSWRGWRVVPRAFTTSTEVSAVVFNNTLNLFARSDTDLVPYRLLMTAAEEWGSWQAIPGGPTARGVSATVFDNSLWVFSVTDNGFPARIVFSDTWGSWTSVPGGDVAFQVVAPVVTSNRHTDGQLRFELSLFAQFPRDPREPEKRRRGEILMSTLADGVWANWGPVPGNGTTLSPLAAAVVGNSIKVFGRGTDNQIYRNQRNGSSWTGWMVVPGMRTLSSPAVVASGTGLNLYAVGEDNKIWRNTQTP